MKNRLLLLGIFGMIFLIFNAINILAVINPATCNGLDIDRNEKFEIKDISLINSRQLQDCRNLAPLDALRIINYLNQKGPRSCELNDPVCYISDVNNDGITSPIDALQVINRLNRCPGLGEPGIYYPECDLNNDNRFDNEDKYLFMNEMENYPIGSECIGEDVSIFISGKREYNVGERIRIN